MDEKKSLNHTKWECKYHVIFIPKYRRKVLYQEWRRYLREVSDGWRSKRRAGLRKVT
jgi:REP-associated tyrosine transposase